jgi:hypothetical protein
MIQLANKILISKNLIKLIPMKKCVVFFLSLIVITAVLTLSCKKNESNENDRTTLVFTSLTSSKTTMNVSEFTTLTAVASGDDLTYTWGSDSGYGTIVGSGGVVNWSVCHPDVFFVTCEVQDKYGEKLSKTIQINVKP